MVVISHRLQHWRQSSFRLAQSPSRGTNPPSQILIDSVLALEDLKLSFNPRSTIRIASDIMDNLLPAFPKPQLVIPATRTARFRCDEPLILQSIQFALRESKFDESWEWILYHGYFLELTKSTDCVF